MILSILICSIPERAELLANLWHKFEEISKGYDVEFLYDATGKELSIGNKRQLLLERAKGKWIVFFDDDDFPNDNYVKWIMEAIKNNPEIDCIGIRGIMTTNGSNKKTWHHRLGYPIIGDGKTPTQYGCDYARPIIHFNPVKREIALAAGFNDLRFGEDMDYAMRLNLMLTNEYFIDEELFHYQYSDKIPFKQKYGIA